MPDAARDDRPYAPFRTFADYKFASRCVKRRMPNAEIDEDLRDMHSGVYSNDCFVTFHNHRDLQKSLEAARISNVPFCSKTLFIDFDGPNFGKRYEIKVEFRDPWKIMKRWACDPTMAHVSTWFSQEKYLCLNGVIDLLNPLYDEPCSGESWRKVDDDFPGPDETKYPSCYLGLHVWLDKGLVSTKVKMHPILFRGGWIDSATRNGSGNGGCTLAGSVIMIRFHRSTQLVRAPQNPKTARDDFLKTYGLHDFKHYLWEFAHSDPYKAAAYDCLHFFDGGIWGRHMWVLLKEYLQHNELASAFNDRMNQFPRWRNLKHLPSPTTIDYSDGQTFLDILKPALPCIVQLLPPKSSLVRLVRLMQKIRAMLGLDVTTRTRLEYLRKVIYDEYEKISQEISDEHGKSLDFLKQHFPCYTELQTQRDKPKHEHSPRRRVPTRDRYFG
ncbi:hypothetical protein B0H19DRAFT_1067901 [Mycena capillaripes]|nr:hypothetical protein B0H19DRAFT_1067901 [Mycena capillaripes]